MQRYRGARCERDLIKQCKAAYIRRSERVFLRLGENVSPTVLGFRAGELSFRAGFRTGKLSFHVSYMGQPAHQAIS
jgi:hypothetical protein